jgi:hypothetical protein
VQRGKDGKGKCWPISGLSRSGEGLGQFIAPHGIALDSRADIYVAEVALWRICILHYRTRTRPRTLIPIGQSSLGQA